jgi:hypothetical protein
MLTQKDNKLHQNTMNLQQLKKHLTSTHLFTRELAVSPSAIALAPSALIWLPACTAHVTTHRCSKNVTRAEESHKPQVSKTMEFTVAHPRTQRSAVCI